MADNDKKSITLADIWAQRFWIGCAVVTVASLVAFIFTSMSLGDERTNRTAALKSKKGEIDSVIGTHADVASEFKNISVHPNKTTQAGMKEKIDLAAVAALDAWKLRYDSQREYLQWPSVIPDLVRNELAAIDQPEISETELSTWNIKNQWKDTFKEEIPKLMPELVAKINAQWDHATIDNNIETDRSVDGAAGIGDEDEVAKDPIIVFWNKENQEIWFEKLTTFKMRNGNLEERPTTMQIFALQQDLWLLGGVFDVIKSVNGDVSANDLATIKQIDHVLIGREIGNVQSIGVLEKVQEVLAPTVAKGKKNIKKKDKNSVSGPTTKRRRMGNATAPKSVAKRMKKKLSRDKAKRKGPPKNNFDPFESNSPFHGRYVDWDFLPISEKELLEALTSDKLVKKSYIQVARRIPIRIAVVMDERKIDEFLAACANSPFVIEIDRFRINSHVPNEGYKPPSKDKKKQDKDKPAEIAGGGSGGGAASLDDDARGAGGGGGSLVLGAIEQRINFDAKVEFYGIVKLYNPVNEDVLYGRKKKNKDTADSGTSGNSG